VKNISEFVASILIAAVLSLAVGLGAGAFIAWKYLGERHLADLATRDANQSRADALAIAAEAERTRLATVRGDRLALDLAKTESALQSKSKELSNALLKTTSGRTCLAADTVRLLNDSAGAASPPGGMPPPAGQPAAADGAVATDTDVAGWVVNARQQYDTCRGRLDRLIDFETAEGEK